MQRVSPLTEWSVTFILRGMSIFEFIADLVGTLAWPIAVIVIVLLLRTHIPGFLRSLRKVKLSGFEIELERTKVEVESALTSEDPNSTSSVNLEPSTSNVADPVGSVLAQYSRLERELRRLLADSGVENVERRSAVQLVTLGVSKGVFSEASAEAVRGVSVLRNLAAHGDASDLSSRKAREYESLVDAVIYSLGAHQKDDS